MDTTMNGHIGEIVMLQSVEPSTETKSTKKPRAKQNNKWVTVPVTIDAGARYVKALVNGQFYHFQSTYRLTEDTLPLMLLGCFSWNSGNYAVGAVAEMIEGQLERASNANKIDKIHIWVLAAITHNTGLLSDLRSSRKRTKEPVRIKLDITMLTLSSAFESQIRALLEAIDTFVWEGQEFKVVINNLKLLPEGYGSAIIAINNKPDLQRFYVLDMGGGTLTLTEYMQLSPGRPSPIVQRIANSGGVSSIIVAIHIGLSKSDKSGAVIIPELIQESLKASTDKECFYLFGNKPKNIASSVKSAMEDWLANNPQCYNILSFALAALLRDEHLYLTGGGFGCKIIKNWVSHWLSKGAANNGCMELLPDSYKINLTGINSKDE